MSTTENTPVVSTEEINQVGNPATAHLDLSDKYADGIYKQSRSAVENILANCVMRQPDGTDVKLHEILGMDNVRDISGFIANDAILPLTIGLGDMHATINTLMGTTYKILNRDLCLHKIPDIFLLQQSLVQLSMATNIYFNRTLHDAKFPPADGWSNNLMELEALVLAAEKESGIEYKEGDVPFRNEMIEIVDIHGNHAPNCRYVNFSYVNSATGVQDVTDIPSIWNDDSGEFIYLPMILLWRPSARLPMTVDDQLNASTLSKAFLAQTTESHEQVHQVRVAQRQAALEAAEEERKRQEELAKNDANAVGVAPAETFASVAQEVDVSAKLNSLPKQPQPCTVPDNHHDEIPEGPANESAND